MHYKNEPCPFCGSNNLIIASYAEYVQCEDCGTFGPSVITLYSNTKEKNVGLRKLIWAKWNERFKQVQ